MTRSQLTGLLRFNLLFCAIFEADVMAGRPISENDIQRFFRANDSVHVLRQMLEGCADE